MGKNEAIISCYLVNYLYALQRDALPYAEICQQYRVLNVLQSAGILDEILRNDQVQTALGEAVRGEIASVRNTL